ncbi:hypothetical protein, partial [Thiolapillus sp.]|uniref:hypothetical protein n=1 Tax=Thiolapillus sp. TaxID=2017437 RepID=UPI003AF4E3E9
MKAGNLQQMKVVLSSRIDIKKCSAILIAVSGKEEKAMAIPAITRDFIRAVYARLVAANRLLKKTSIFPLVPLGNG